MPVPDTVEPVTRFSMTVLKISPNWGTPDGGDVAIIQGINLPLQPMVFIGPLPAQVTRARSDSITIETPPAPPGIYDVSVLDPRFGMITIRNAFTYSDTKPAPGDVLPVAPSLPPDYEPGDPLPPVTPAPAPAPSPSPSQPTTGGSDPATGTGPGTTTPETSPTTVPDPESAPTAPTTTLPTPPGRPRLQLAAELSDQVPNGHRVVVGSPIDISPADWAAQSCSRPACGAGMHAVQP